MSAILELEAIPCPLCGTPDATLLCAERDLALGVPWQFPLARCERCGPLYQNPRVRRAQLERMYPADCPPHARDPDLRRALRARSAAARWVLARALGSMRALVERCGGRVVDEWHWSTPRWIIRSARFALTARGTAPARLALAALDSRLGGGLVKLVLEVALKAAGPARRGEVVRYFIRHRGPA